MTGNEIIGAALRKLNVLATGEPLNATAAQNGLVALNELLDSLSIDRTAVFTESAATYNLIANKSTYTLGPGGDFSAVRPIRITRAALIIQTMRYQLPIVEDAEWAARSFTTRNSIPAELYSDGGYPLVTLGLDPGPTDSTWQLEIWSWTALQQFANVTLSYYFPPGYARMLKSNLALELAAEYSKQPSEALVKQAADSLAAVRTFNLTSDVMDVDAGVFPGSRSGRQQNGWIGNYTR